MPCAQTYLFLQECFDATTRQPQRVNTKDDARQRGNMSVERKIVLSARQRTRIILYIVTMLTATQCIWIGFNTQCLSTANFHRLKLFRDQYKKHTVHCVDSIRSFEKHSQNFEKRLRHVDPSVFLSVRPPAGNNSTPTVRISLKFDI